MTVRRTYVKCDHGDRALECPACIQEWAEEQAWHRAVRESLDAARRMGFDRPDAHTVYLEVLDDLVISEGGA